jgi:hypothetical protein
MDLEPVTHIERASMQQRCGGTWTPKSRQPRRGAM